MPVEEQGDVRLSACNGGDRGDTEAYRGAGLRSEVSHRKPVLVLACGSIA